MAKSKEEEKKVLIVVRPAKRGFIVEVPGSGNLYPCMDAQGIGDAVIEILEDPDQEGMEFEAPAPKREPRRSQAAPPSAEEAEDEGPEEREPEPRGGQGREGWTAGDELMVNLLGTAAEKLRNLSWRGK